MKGVKAYDEEMQNHNPEDDVAEGFCDEAWKAIYQYVFALANDSHGWYLDDWIDPKYDGVAICSCNDGLRPVIIKVERTDEDEQY